MKKILYFLLLVLYVIGLIGGIGYCVYNHAWVIAIGVVVLGVMGFPMAKECFEKLTH